MKSLWTSTLALVAISTFETIQQAKADSIEPPSPYIHLIRGGGHVGGHAERRGEGRGEGYGANRGEGMGTARDIASDHPAAEDRIHSLDHNLRNEEGYGLDGDWGMGGGWGCAQVDENGNCISYQ